MNTCALTPLKKIFFKAKAFSFQPFAKIVLPVITHNASFCVTKTIYVIILGYDAISTTASPTTGPIFKSLQALRC